MGLFAGGLIRGGRGGGGRLAYVRITKEGN